MDESIYEVPIVVRIQAYRRDIAERKVQRVLEFIDDVLNQEIADGEERIAPDCISDVRVFEIRPGTSRARG